MKTTQSKDEFDNGTRITRFLLNRDDFTESATFDLLLFELDSKWRENSLRDANSIIISILSDKTEFDS